MGLPPLFGKGFGETWGMPGSPDNIYSFSIHLKHRAHLCTAEMLEFPAAELTAGIGDYQVHAL